MTYRYVRVTTPIDRHDHVLRVGLFLDGEIKALCGVRPFPDKWVEVRPGGDGVPCVGCVNGFRKARK